MDTATFVEGDASAARRGFRRHALDGAALYFQPATGVHVRVATRATAALRRTAPRVAMFGITNACNLACTFCSRDVARPSAWTVDSAAAVLRGLHDAGTLEVAYGGGEPFAFRGFAELVAELDQTTALAQHVTTNGVLVRADTWPRFAGRFGQVRISIYDGVPWRAAAAVLADHGQRWGANVLVDARALATLPATLADLAADGCHDVSLLAYVGPDHALHLDRAGEARLAAVIAASPVACRLSVCFGDRVAVPRLATGDDHGDCGAGRDFVSITPDRRVQSCSFQDRSLAGATAAEVLAAWRAQQPFLAAPSPRRGCARLRPLTVDPAPPPPISIWQAFSGNNSGECVLVASFREVAAAEAFLAELVPDWTPDGDYSPAWRQLFLDEGLVTKDFEIRPTDHEDASPRELVGLGRTVVAMQYAVDDAFPELRALAWKRGAHVVAGGIHLHDPPHVLIAIQAHGGDDAERLVAAPLLGAALHRHGDLVLGLVPLARRTLAGLRDAVVQLAGGRGYGAEPILAEVSEATLTAARQRFGSPRAAGPRRLWCACWQDPDGARLATLTKVLPFDRTTYAGTAALVEPAPDRKRLAVVALRAGATVDPLDGERVRLTATIWYAPPASTRGTRPAPRVVDVAHVEATVGASLPRASSLTVAWPGHRGYRPSPIVTIETDAPAAALRVLAGYADRVGAQLTVWAAELDPLAAALERVADAARGR